MPNGRVVFLNLPRMLAELLERSLADGEGIQLVATIDGAPPLAETVTATGAQLVVAGAEGIGPEQVDALLEEDPFVKVISVVAGGRESVFVEMRPNRVPLGQLSPDRLATVIRDALEGAPAG